MSNNYNGGMIDGLNGSLAIARESAQNIVNVLEGKALSPREKALVKTVLSQLLDELEKKIEIRKESRYFEGRIEDILSSNGEDD